MRLFCSNHSNRSQIYFIYNKEIAVSCFFIHFPYLSSSLHTVIDKKHDIVSFSSAIGSPASIGFTHAGSGRIALQSASQITTIITITTR